MLDFIGEFFLQLVLQLFGGVVEASWGERRERRSPRCAARRVTWFAAGETVEVPYWYSVAGASPERGRGSVRLGRWDPTEIHGSWDGERFGDLFQFVEAAQQKPAEREGQLWLAADSPSVVLRAPLWQRAVCSGAEVFAVGVLAVGCRDQGGWWLLAAALLTGVAAVVGVQTWIVRVEAGPDQLVIVNWFRTLRVPWHEVTKVGVDDAGVWVRRADGSEVHPSAFRLGPRAAGFVRHIASDAAAQLETIRRQRQAAIRRQRRPSD